METFEPSTGQLSLPLTSSVGDSPASPSVSPGNVKGPTMIEICGQSSAVRWQPSSPVGCLVKMCLAQSRTLNPSCSLTWKPLGTKPPYWGFRLAPSGRRTDGNGSGLWLGTPTAGTGTKGRSKKWREGKTPNPQEFVQMFPSPSAQEAGEGPLLERLVTKDGQPAKRGERAYNPKTGKHVQITLNRAVKMWPTMTSCEWKGRGPNSKQQGLTNAIGCTGGQLNPMWVEWLMGYPIGWTDLEG